LALWAAVALHAGFAGWLVSMALIGLVMVAVLYTLTLQGGESLRGSQASRLMPGVFQGGC
jgi:hypothetical protein